MLLRQKLLKILVALNVLGTFVSATTIVVGFSKTKVVIAADSRLTNEDGTHQDTSCKITALRRCEQNLSIINTEQLAIESRVDHDFGHGAARPCDRLSLEYAASARGVAASA